MSVRVFDAAIAEILAQLPKEGVLFIGELHGTREMPLLVPQFVKALVLARTSCTVHWEVPQEYEHAVRSALQTDSSWSVLGGWFSSAGSFGGWTEAHIAVLRELSGLSREGDVSIACFDHLGCSSPAERERQMAQTLIDRFSRERERFHLVYCGNVHAQTRNPQIQGLTYPPVGWDVREVFPAARSLNLVTLGGAAQCATLTEDGVVLPPPNKVGPSYRVARRAGDLGQLNDQSPWDWELNVGEVSAALPVSK